MGLPYVAERRAVHRVFRARGLPHVAHLLHARVLALEMDAYVPDMPFEAADTTVLSRYLAAAPRDVVCAWWPVEYGLGLACLSSP